MPPDNSAVVGQSGAVQFPQNGDSIGSDITRSTASAFSLGPIGLYQIYFIVTTTTGGQLGIRVNGTYYPRGVFGRGTSSDQPFTGSTLLRTTVVNTIIDLANPNTGALTISSLAGGALAVAAHLIITRLQ
jgi:hypothetical protein